MNAGDHIKYILFIKKIFFQLYVLPLPQTLFPRRKKFEKKLMTCETQCYVELIEEIYKNNDGMK